MQISADFFAIGPHCQSVMTCVDCTDKHVVYYPALCVCCDYFILWSLASSSFTGAQQSLWCRPCSRWLRWSFSAWWPLVQLETAVALLQWLFRPGACSRTNHVFATMRSLQCNQCQDSMRQINPNGVQSLRYSMHNYDIVAINIFELSWVGLKLCVFSLPISLVMIERIHTLSYYHHQIGSMNYHPLFSVRSGNNGMRCMSLYILMSIS